MCAAEVRQLADHLDDRDLVRPDLGQDGAELGLLLGRGGGTGVITTRRRSGGRSGGHGGGGCNAVAILEALDELRQLEHGHLVDCLEQVVLRQGCHGLGVSLSRYVVSRWGVYASAWRFCSAT